MLLRRLLAGAVSLCKEFLLPLQESGRMRLAQPDEAGYMDGAKQIRLPVRSGRGRESSEAGPKKRGPTAWMKMDIVLDRVPLLSR